MFTIGLTFAITTTTETNNNNDSTNKFCKANDIFSAADTISVIIYRGSVFVVLFCSAFLYIFNVYLMDFKDNG